MFRGFLGRPDHSSNRICASCGVVGGSLPYKAMPNTAVFTERLEVRLRPDQKERLDLVAGLLDSDIAALVRLAIDNMFYDLDEQRRRDSSWQQAVSTYAATPRS